MANSTLSSNMSLVIPTVGTDPGPQWAFDLNASLNLLDSHNHTSGYGVPIPVSGMTINADLPFNGNNGINLRSLRFTSQGSVLSGASDLGCIYESGVDLYYNDGSGNKIRLTQSGGVAGTSGSIGGLSSPATATYVSASSTFVWQSAASTPANMDGASFIFRNLVASSKGLTLSPPNSMAADYSLVLPPLPASQKIMTLDASGNITAPYTVDNSTITISSNVIGVPAGGITTTQLSAAVLALLVPSGVISPYGGTSAPTGYLICDGTSYLRATYPNLFTAIGTAYGAADGTHFNVPDLRGQFIRGVTGASSNDPDASSRTAMNTGGNTGNNVGSIQSGQIQSHSHVQTAGTVISGFGASNTGFGASVVNTGISTAATGGNETRPTNAYVNFIIKT